MNDNEYEIIKAYSVKEMTALEVIKQLDISRFEIYPLLKKYNLDLPQESDEEAMIAAKLIQFIVDITCQ